MKLSGIQYLRGIAALAVVLDHAVAMAAFDKYFGQKVIWYDYWVSGSLGVNLFFVISGFIMVVSSLDDGPDRKPVKTSSQFFKARFFRIVPLMWISILTYAVLRYLSNGFLPLESYINAIFLLPAGDVDPNIIWTLRQEAFFYLVFLLSYIKFKSHIPIILWVLVSVIISLMSVNTKANYFLEVLGNFFHPTNCNFLIGVLVGFYYKKFHANFSNSRIVNFLSGSLIFYLIFFMAIMWIKTSIHKEYNIIFESVLYGLFFGFLVLLTSGSKSGNSKFMLLLGNASYCIYLFHPHFESALLKVFSYFKNTLQLELAVVLISILASGLSVMVYIWVEKPLVKFFKRYY